MPYKRNIMKTNAINFLMFVNKKGTVNVNLVNKYKDWIIENTSEYDWLTPTLGQRVRLKIDVPTKFHCDCGKRLSWNKSKGFIFKKTCNNQKCVAKKRDSSSSIIKFKETISNRKCKKEYNIETLIHSKFEGDKRKEMFQFLHAVYGKETERIFGKTDIVGTHIIQAGLDISLANLSESVLSPESTLQRLGRLDRWWDYLGLSTLTIFKIEHDLSKNEFTLSRY